MTIKTYITENVLRLYSHSGLANRLRLFSTYREEAQKYDKKIEMHWMLQRACWTPYDELFLPVQGIEFIYKKQSKNSKRDRPENSAISLCEIDHKKLCNFYLDIKPREEILQEVESLISSMKRPFCACHIRRTDINRIQSKYGKSAPSNQSFFDFIEKSGCKNVFIATDNKQTQQEFLKVLGDRMITYDTIAKNGSSRYPIRTTSVRHAVIDMFTCIFSDNFMGTTCSSFTGFINDYRNGLCQQKNGL